MLFRFQGLSDDIFLTKMYSQYGRLLILVRGIFYAGVVVFFLAAAASRNETVQGIAGGIIMADIITWLGRSIIKMDKYLSEFAWEALINVGIVVVLVYKFDIVFPGRGEGMAIGFMAFLVASGVKVCWYVMQEMSEEN
jgi:hypothetical protein